MDNLFRLQPFGSIDEFVFESFDYKAILEDAKDDKNESLIKKIWDGIVKIFNWIKEKFISAINWIKSLFVNNSKSAEQVADEIGLKPAEVQDDSKLSPTEKAVRKLSLHLTKDDKLKFIVKPYDEKKVSIVFSYLKNPKMLEDLEKLIKDITNGNLDAAKSTALIIRQGFGNVINPTIDREIIISMEELMNFQKKINALTDLIPKMISIEIPDDIEHRGQLLFVINNLNYSVLNLQMGVNYLMTTFKDLYSLDDSYKATISDKETAALFASKSMEAGIPSKYIARNLFTVLSEELKGKDSNVEKPIMGETRIIFKPDKDPNSVFKIAINKSGVYANKIEYDITKKFIEIGLDETIAKVLNSYNNFTAIDAEKADTSKLCGRSEIMRLMNRINHVAKTHKLNFSIKDIHIYNVGRIGDRIVIIDYGSIGRIK